MSESVSRFLWQSLSLSFGEDIYLLILSLYIERTSSPPAECEVKCWVLDVRPLLYTGVDLFLGMSQKINYILKFLN